MKFDRNEKTQQNKFVRDVLTKKAWISFLFKEKLRSIGTKNNQTHYLIFKAYDQWYLTFLF